MIFLCVRCRLDAPMEWSHKLVLGATLEVAKLDRNKTSVPLLLAAALLVSAATPTLGPVRPGTAQLNAGLWSVSSIRPPGGLFSLQDPAGRPGEEQRLIAIEDLASTLAEQIAKSGKKKVVVVDLEGPGAKPVPLGAWLADQLSASLTKAGKDLEVIDRARLRAALEQRQLSTRDIGNPKIANMLAELIGAEVVVKGSFAAAQNGVGITLAASEVPNRMTLGTTTGKIPMTKQMEAILEVPLQTLPPRDGVFKPGTGGVGYPSCVHCPSPSYTGEARRAKLNGMVVLQATITPQGEVSDMAVVKGPGFGLERNAVEAVRNWRFKPATDQDGKPVAVRVLIEVKFAIR